MGDPPISSSRYRFMRLSTHGTASVGWRAAVGRVTRNELPGEERADHVLIADSVDGKDLSGYAGVLSQQRATPERLLRCTTPIVHNISVLDHLVVGDVVALNPSGYVRTLYRIGSHHNAILATERCNSYCLMCSQPPKEVDDSDRMAEHLRVIDLMSADTPELGITGGEPTLLKHGLLELIRRCKERLPTTAVHVLSNGRLFYYGLFARQLAELEHPDLMLGIPLYSDIDSQHDHVVQCRGAFDDTLVGIANLGRFGVRVEVRVVVHQLTWQRLPEIVEFVYRNMPFASHVALMGLEIMGFAIPNLTSLWIDPWDYRKELERATLFLASRGMRVSIYNHQLCTVPRSVWPYCRQSISDWKNEYLAVCDGCSVRQECGGFFASSIGRVNSAHIHPLSDASCFTT
jgi:His-Xaa-Ser system radical SAM maturase HxsC